ncbi:D-Ala-D-Ala carboxypeptidase family metallohydrolase [Streptomyces camponoticapitis]|uniref:D-Ala-D-Ala carboxypeptidase family metallohydrolase n=1 Tax=Streptomyces camponoticapitis TaxID=1616125 RepID=UPI001E5CB871|nr:D-Ala-D-Ala carboxypeptidase family metallohydrolase [Streptomyces camponoticapitis]
MPARAAPAQADASCGPCPTPSEAMSGADVTQPRIRVAGHVDHGEILSVDGSYGPRTEAAVTRFQQAHGPAADHHPERTTVHFTYAELNSSDSDRSGGAVGVATAQLLVLPKSSGLRTMWRQEAIDGDSNNRHPYGDAADPVGSPSFRRLAQRARTHGFGGSYGSGCPDHNDHPHVDGRACRSWSAPDRGV